MNEIKTVIKIDLDLKEMHDAKNLIKDRLKFLSRVGLFDFNFIESVELLQKKTYSCKINLNIQIKDPLYLILIQSILGDDYKRTAITFRDYKANCRNWNRLFNIKRYSDGTYIKSKSYDITEYILKKENEDL